MKFIKAFSIGLIFVFLLCAAIPYQPPPQAVNANPPPSPVRLIFIHHSTGENWLNDENGGLARALQANNYFPSDTNYGWGPDAIGDRTDIPNWTEWFASENTGRYMQAVFQESEVHSPFERTLQNPGGENQVILIKSCFPNSALEGNPNDPPTPGSDLTVGNAKYVYNEILKYFKTRPDKLFVVITAPPLINSPVSANARAFNQWLVNNWLQENAYTQPNVAVFDFYNILTGPNNHHRFVNGAIEHVINDKRNTEFYPSEDDHPNQQGNQKATTEFLAMLNIFYNRWKASAPVGQPDQSQNTAPDTPPMEEQNVPAAPVAPSGSGNMLFDFETEQPVWEASIDEAAETTALDCQSNSSAAASGSGSLQIVFNVAANSWATCSNFFDAPRDLSKTDGVQFMLRVDEASSEMHLDVFTGPDGERATFARIIPLPKSNGKWVVIQTRWSDFKRVEWETDGGSTFNHPEQITGFAFGFPTGDKVNQGVVYVDAIQTFKAGQAALPAEPAVQANAVQPAGVEEGNPPAEEELAQAAPQKPASGIRRLLPICGSALILPFFSLVFVFRSGMRS